MLELLRKESTALQYVLYDFLQVTDLDIYVAQFLDDNLYSGHLDNICLTAGEIQRKTHYVSGESAWSQN
jgi:hypothetical protein